jgi:hypothetical protein
MDPIAELVAWRIGSFKFGGTTVAAAIVLVILVVCLIFVVLRLRRGPSK